MFRCFLTVGAAIILSSCSTKLPELNVEEQWAEAMRRQSLYAVFPITEDIMVGDVLLDTRNAKTDDNDAFQVIRLARTDPDLVLNALCDDRDRRVVIASRVKEKTDEKDSLNETENEKFYHDCRQLAPLASAAGVLIGHSDSRAPIRLSRSDIPEATVARLTVAQLGAAGFFGNFAASLGYGSSSRVAMTIKLTDLESLELASRHIPDILYKGTGRTETAINPNVVVGLLAQKWPEGARQLCEGNFSALRGKAEIAAVTRVEYANGIHYEFAESSERALRAVLDLSALMEGQSQPTQVPSISASGDSTVTISGNGNQPASNGDDDAGNNIADAENRAAARLTSLLGAVTGGPSTGGVSGSLGIGTTGNLRLVATYSRPMAVGAGAKLVFPVQDAVILNEEKADISRALNACARVLDLKSRIEFGDPADYCSATLPGDMTRMSDFRKSVCERPRYRYP